MPSCWLSNGRTPAILHHSRLKNLPDYSPTIGPIIRDHIDKLISGNSPADAQKLIEAALAMNPPLDHKIVGQIRDQQAQLNQKPPAP